MKTVFLKQTALVLKLFSILFLLSAGTLSAQVKLTASAPENVAVNQQFQLTFKINANGGQLQPPDLSQFNFYGSQQGFESINGSVSMSYTYFLSAKREGTFTIGAAKISVGGKTFSSDPITIKVSAGSGNVPTQNNNSNNTNGNNNTSSQTSNNQGDVFVALSLNKTKAYLGEEIIATFKLYSRLDVSGIQFDKAPTFSGFWSQEVELPQQINLTTETVNGVSYQVGVLKKTVIYPQRTGSLTIESFEGEVMARKLVKQQGFWGIFNQYQDIPVKFASTPKTVTVTALPPNAPTSFTNAVGDFSFDVNIDQTEAKTGDALTLKVNIKGSGNLKLIENINIQFPSDFDTYPPQISNNIATTSSGATGSKQLDYLIIPRNPGQFTIPPIEFTFFNPQTGVYKTLKSEAIVLNITKGEGTESTNIVSGLSKEDIQLIGSDIRFLKTGNINLTPKGGDFYGSFFFWSFYIGGILAFAIIFLVRRKKIRENANVLLTKNKRANKVSKQRLKTALGYLKANKSDEFYTETLKALWGYLSDKLIIPVSELNRDRITEVLKKNNIEQEVINSFLQLIDTCEFAKFAPSKNSEHNEEVYKNAEEIIGKLEQKLK